MYLSEILALKWLKVSTLDGEYHIWLYHIMRRYSYI